ncbi:DUF3000 domain-containing protein [Aquipuribacter hungaricus]|uniref:DUF3000 domain-containing protein n=1 Tax=Aquipuribacter hungaricus TaxID=545624 RepID=A0ABV7WEH3_9MICO
MATTRSSAPSALVFDDAVAVLRSARVRPEVALTEIPPPRRVAPFAHAVEGHVDLAVVRAGARDGEDADEAEEAGGRFVLLHDPSAPDAWGGDLRVIALVKAVVEPELAEDPMLAEVVWAWLGETLVGPDAPATRLGGTVTRVVSESFGSLADRPAAIQVELRASWSPLGPLDAQLGAWADVLCRLAGLPPLPAGVSALPRRR